MGSPQQYKEVLKRVNAEFIGKLNEIIFEKYKDMNINEDSESKSTETTLNIEELSNNSIVSEEEIQCPSRSKTQKQDKNNNDSNSLFCLRLFTATRRFNM